MKCPECYTEVNDNQEYCPNCGSPLPHSHHSVQDDEPTIGRGLVVFIIIGTIFLVAFGFAYYANHKNDPEYTQTAIEPDSNLADKNTVHFDTVAQDTAAKDSIDKMENNQAEKVFNSIRGRHRSRHTDRHDDGGLESQTATESSSENSAGSNAESAPPSTPTAPKPHVESLESE